MSMRTITLTGRPPVRIEDEDWPVIASANYMDWLGKRVVHWQSCDTNRSVHVLQHEDGRAIVYAVHAYDDHDGHDYAVRRGVLLDSPGAGDYEPICSAIQDVCDDVNRHLPDPDPVWTELAFQCIADLPVELLN